MSKVYHSVKSGLTVASGTLKSVAPDGLSVVIASGRNVKDGENYKFEPVDITVRVQLPVEGYTIGSPITAAGWQGGENIINAEFCSCKESACAKLTDSVVVLSGDVLSAYYNEEKDRETGAARLTKAGTPRKPHFDISVAIGSGKERVRHVVRVYGEDDIKTMQGRFKNFDRQENPMYVTIVTQPGQQYTTTNEYNGRTYTNTNESHMGANSLDIIFTADRTKKQETPAQEAAAPAQTVAQEAPVQAQAQPAAQSANGFNASAANQVANAASLDGIDVNAIDEMLME